jgi:hypothetical protein
VSEEIAPTKADLQQGRGLGGLPQPALAGLIFLLAFVPRALDLAVFITADEAKSWTGRAILFLQALLRRDFAATFDSPAPGITTVWLGAIGLVADYLAHDSSSGGLAHFLETLPFDPIEPGLLPWLRLPVVLVTALSIVGVYLLARRLFGVETALLGASLLALDPFYLALSRILGHDSLVATFMTLSILALLAYLQTVTPNPPTGDLRLMALAGAVAGLAFLSKSPSLFLGAFVAIVTPAAFWLRGRESRAGLRAVLRGTALALLVWGIAAGLTFFLLWPAMWADPLYPPRRIVGDALRASGGAHQKGSFLFGQPLADPGPLFYPVNGLFRVTPVEILGLGLALVALLAALRSPGKGRSRLQTAKSPPGVGSYEDPPLNLGAPGWAGVLLLYALLFGVLITFGGKKQDRYLLPTLLPLALVGAYGWMAALRWLAGQGRKWLLPLGSLLVVCVQALFSLPHHPYYFTYYNPLLGGGPAAEKTVLVGWGEGLDRAARYLNSLPDAHDVQAVSWYSSTFEPFFVGQTIYKVEDEKLSRSSKPSLAADYVVLYINQIQRQIPSAGALQFLQREPPVYVVRLHGIDYAWVYPMPGMRYAIGGQARLVGQAELLGFDLEGVMGEVPPQVRPGDSFRMRLYWEWQGKRQEDPIVIDLVDYDGVSWGEVEPLPEPEGIPFDQWEEGMVGRSDYLITVYPDAPPGLYQLKSWIYNPQKDEIIGFFPVEYTEMCVEVVGVE